MDVDGTLTDGKIHISSVGETFKSFDVKDGYAIHDILPQYGIVPIIITGRSSRIVEQRALELGITELYQGINDKIGCLKQVINKYNCLRQSAAYIGDDLPDLSAMSYCGISGCPADAVKEVREVCNYVCRSVGGSGAVREFIEWIISKLK